MKSQLASKPAKKQENDFIDFIVGAGVFGGLLFVIFLGVTAAELILGF